MVGEEAMLLKIIREPSTAAWAVFADWLEENGRYDEAAFLRTGIEINRLTRDQGGSRLHEREIFALINKQCAIRQAVGIAVKIHGITQNAMPFEMVMRELTLRGLAVVDMYCDDEVAAVATS